MLSVSMATYTSRGPLEIGARPSTLICAVLTALEAGWIRVFSRALSL